MECRRIIKVGRWPDNDRTRTRKLTTSSPTTRICVAFFLDRTQALGVSADISPKSRGSDEGFHAGCIINSPPTFNKGPFRANHTSASASDVFFEKKSSQRRPVRLPRSQCAPLKSFARGGVGSAREVKGEKKECANAEQHTPNKRAIVRDGAKGAIRINSIAAKSPKDSLSVPSVANRLHSPQCFFFFIHPFATFAN